MLARPGRERSLDRCGTRTQTTGGMRTPPFSAPRRAWGWGGGAGSAGARVLARAGTLIGQWFCVFPKFCQWNDSSVSGIPCLGQVRGETLT